MCKQFSWSDFFAGLTGIGTILVATAAIYGDRIRARLEKPKLRIIPYNLRGSLAEVLSGTTVIRYHLKVINDKPKYPAKNCRVLLKEIHSLGQDGMFHKDDFPIPRQFKWAPSPSTPYLVTVHKEQILDLGQLSLENETSFIPIIFDLPNLFPGFIEANETKEYHLVIAADNFASSKDYVLRITWNGL